LAAVKFHSITFPSLLVAGIFMLSLNKSGDAALPRRLALLALIVLRLATSSKFTEPGNDSAGN
jgi:hypothetical protein